VLVAVHMSNDCSTAWHTRCSVYLDNILPTRRSQHLLYFALGRDRTYVDIIANF